MAEKKKKASTMRKLIPAVAMLATSAVMLSSATYAWFTLNKEVEITGLTMSATAGDSLEISLGEIGDAPTNNAPAYNSSSWKRAISIDEYYSSVGKLLPASSDTGLTMYKVDEEGVFGGGTKVESGATVEDPKQSGSASLNLGAATEASPYKVDTTNGSEGYYIDVPMWIRSTQSNGNATVYCTVTISSAKEGVVTDADNAGDELMNAVRVAIIPIDTAQSGFKGESDGISGLSLSGSAGYTAESKGGSTLAFTNNTTVQSGITSPVIFGLTNDTYTAGSTVLNGTGATYETALVGTQTVATAYTSGSYTSGTTPNTAVFTIPQADANNFSGVSFIARIWIEGESVYCNDATADQDWNIDFHFTLDPVSTTPAEDPST